MSAVSPRRVRASGEAPARSARSSAVASRFRAAIKRRWFAERSASAPCRAGGAASAAQKSHLVRLAFMANRQNITERHVPVPRNKKPNEEDPMSTRNSRFRMAAAFALAALLPAGAAAQQEVSGSTATTTTKAMSKAPPGVTQLMLDSAATNANDCTHSHATYAHHP